jgi:hypothetical protein
MIATVAKIASERMKPRPTARSSPSPSWVGVGSGAFVTSAVYGATRRYPMIVRRIFT